MIYLLPTIIIFGGLFLYAEFDPWFKELLYIVLAGVRLELRKIPMLIHMKWDLFWMKRNMNKYLKLAEQIQHEIESQRAGMD